MKVLKVILIVIAILLAVVLSLALILGFSILDDTDNSNQEILDNPKELTTLINEYAVNSMENTTVDKKISFLLSEYEVNYILSSIKNALSIPFINVKSIYAIYKDDGTVLFEAPISYMMFSSCVKGNVDLQLEEDGTLKLSISSISLGSLSSSNGLLTTLIKTFVNFDKIEKSLLEQGIELSISYDDTILTISVSKDQMKTIVSNLIKEDGENELFNAIIETVIGDNTLFNIYFNEEYKIGAVLYLQDLLYTETPLYDLHSGETTLSTIKEKITILWNNHIVNYDNLNLVFNYLVRGYNALQENEQSYINNLSFESIGITNIQTYQGIIERSSLTMAKIFLEATTSGVLSLATITLRGYYEMKITENNFNELLNSLDFIGTSFAFIKEDGTCANITISSLYAKFYDQSLSMYVVLDINGEYINARVDANVVENNEALLSLSIQNLYLGSKEINDSAEKSLISFLSDSLEDSEFLSIDIETETISIDLSSYLTDSFFSRLIDLQLNKISLNVTESYNGCLVLRFSK